MRPAGDSETIAAIATAPGSGGIGIIRISGPGAVDAAARLFHPSENRPLGQVPTHTLHHGLIRHPSTGEILDEVLVSVMRAPRTYTREDTVEIQAHGGPFVLNRILELAIGEGCRLAAPGEFTKRAFLNGRIDLTAAEAVMELIEVRTESAHRAAVARLRGDLGRQIARHREALVGLVSMLEAFIDFPEEELGNFSRERVLREAKDLFGNINALYATARAGRILQEGLAVAIVGPPNAGKSSLLNRLLDEDRAIVSEIPGTTRDLIEEPVNADGLKLRIIDTAGLRPSDDPVEIEGMKRTRAAIEAAELVLLVLDAVVGWTPEMETLLRTASGNRKAIIVINKADLAPKAARSLCENRPVPVPVVVVSALHGSGMEDLRATLSKVALELTGGPRDPVMVARLRHSENLKACCEHLELAVRSLEDGMPEDLVALDLRAAMDRLGEIIGVVTTEDILDRIFSQFCIGK